MQSADDELRETFEAMYRDFNARYIDAVLERMTSDVEWPKAWEGGYVKGHDDVRDYWTRQWAEIDPTVTPVAFVVEPDGRIDVTVDQVVRDRAGNLLAEQTVHHVYRMRGAKVEGMEIRND